jgi:folate-binding protein YgfZ
MSTRLNRFKIRVKAEIEPLEWRCIAVRGATVDGVVAWGDGVDLLGADPQPPAGIDAGTADDYLAARIDAAWPAMGAEIVPGTTIPAETNVIDSAVSFTKGCYPGQELVERMDSRGASAPRTLQRVDAPDGVKPGDPVLRDGVEIGRYTSVFGSKALALVKRSASERGD